MFKNKEIGFGSIHDINKTNKTSTWDVFKSKPFKFITWFLSRIFINK